MKFTNYIKLKEAQPAAPAAPAGNPPPPPKAGTANPPTTPKPGATNPPPAADQKTLQATQAFKQGVETLEQNMMILKNANQLDKNIENAFLKLKALIPKK
jgi:hypothetical protein